MEYYRYWGLVRPPFSLSPDPDKLYMSRQHREGLLRLQYTIESNKGGALLVSENAGDGKTSLLRFLARDMSTDGNARVAFITHPTLTANQMIGEIGRQLGLERAYRSKIRKLNELEALLVRLHDQGQRALVIVDEGQMLAHRPDILQELRILLNFCVADSFLLTFVLSGQKPLEGVVRGMPEFWQRLPVRFFLGNLDCEDTANLVRHRLGLAGLADGREIFSQEAYRELFQASKGCPRVICSIADLALVIGRSIRVKQIDAPEIVQARADMEKTTAADNFSYYYFLKTAEKAKATPATRAFDVSPGMGHETKPPAAGAPAPRSAPAVAGAINTPASPEESPAPPETPPAFDEVASSAEPAAEPAQECEPEAPFVEAPACEVGESDALPAPPCDETTPVFAEDLHAPAGEVGPRERAQRELVRLSRHFRGAAADATEKRLSLDPREQTVLVMPRRRNLFSKTLSVDVLRGDAERNLPCAVAVTNQAIRMLGATETFKAAFGDVQSVRAVGCANGHALVRIEMDLDVVYQLRLNDVDALAPGLVDSLVTYARAMMREQARIPVEA